MTVARTRRAFLVTVCMAVAGMGCAPDRGYFAPEPPPRSARQQEDWREQERHYEPQERSDWSAGRLKSLYREVGQPSFAVLVNRYPVEGNPALDAMAPVYERQADRQSERFSHGTTATKKVRVESGDTDISVTETLPGEHDSESHASEASTERLGLPVAGQGIWEQLNDFEIEDAITSTLIRYGIQVADAETLKTSAPAQDVPPGTIGSIPNAGVQVLAAYYCDPATFRISIKAVRTEGGGLLAHATDTVSSGGMASFDMESARLMTESATIDFLHELTRVWAQQSADQP